MTRHPTGRSALATACTLLLLSALVALPEAARAQATGQPQAVVPQGVPVATAVAARRDVPIELRNIGAVQAFQSVVVRARVDGALDRVFFEEGQDVRPGDRLALIDPRPYAAALAQAQARKAQDQVQLANAQRDLSRYATLLKGDFASRQQYDTQVALVGQYSAALQGDDAAIAAAQVNLDYCNITAPIAGRIGLRQIDVGNIIHAADASGPGIVTIQQIHPIAMIFTLPQENLPAIRAAMARGKLPVFAYTQDNRTRLSQGTLLTTDNAIDPATGTIKLKAVFDNADDALWPGQFVNAHLQLGLRHDALTVPSVAVQRGPNGTFVYVVKPDNTAAVQAVTLEQDDGQTAVVSGLDEGATVVVNGQSRLQNGTPVAPTAAKAS